VLSLLVVHEPVNDYRRVSWAKKAAASFKISRSYFSTRFSRSN